MANYIVTTLDDETFGGAETAGTPDGAGLSLREALGLALANGAATPDSITFDAGLTSGVDPGVDDGHLVLTNDQLVISSVVTIDGDTDGDRKADITVDAAGNSRVFGFFNGPSTLKSLDITGGNAGSVGGGGLYVYDGAQVTVVDTSIRGNSAIIGGGISNAGTLTLINATVSGNTATGTFADLGANAFVAGGGGIQTFGPSTTTLVNTTVSGNHTGARGGGIDNLGTLSLTNSTVSGNSADIGAGGIDMPVDDGHTTTLINSLVAGDSSGSSVPAGTEIFGNSFSFSGLNVIGIGGDTDASDQRIKTPTLGDLFSNVGGDPHTAVQSGVLADNGGPVETIAIKIGGIAHNPAGTVVPTDTADADRDGNTTESLPIDARGFARAVGATVDIGAVELQATPASMVVTTLADGGDDAYGDGDIVAETADGDGLSLREALALANGDPTTADTITFQQDLIGGTLTLANGELVISSDLSIDGDIDGDGGPDITVSGDATDPSAVFHAYSGTSSINGLTITGGAALYGAGVSVGAYAYYGYADVTISNSIISNNIAFYGGGVSVDIGSALRLVNSVVSDNEAFDGGGIAVNEDATLTVISSTVANNHADLFLGAYGYGGGISNAGTATLINSTISGNSGYYGGGLYNNGDITLINTTLANNSAELGGGLYNYNPACGCGSAGTATLINSTVSGNSALYRGGGIDNNGGTLNLINSIVAGNASLAAEQDIDALPGDISYSGVNIVGVGNDSDTSDGVINTPTLEDLFREVAVNALGVEAGVLADNGGPVQTIGIRPNGVARDAGDVSELPADSEDLDGDTDTAEDLPVDARGFARVVGASVDVGAFEVRITALAGGNIAAYTEQSAAVALDPDLIVTADSTLVGATVQIVDILGGDTLHFSNQNGIGGGYDSDTGLLTLSGNASAEEYQSALRSITFDNLSSDDPTAGNSDPARTITWQVDDGLGLSNVVNSQIEITAIDDAPVNTMPGAQQARTDTDHTIAGLSVSDPDIAAGDITVTLTVEHGTIHVRDDLGAGFLDAGDITGNNSDTVTLRGSLASVNATLAASRGVVYLGDFNYAGPDTLTMASDDGDQTGVGGPLQDVDSIAINVTERHHARTDFNPDSNDVLWQRVGDGALLNFHMNGPHLTSFGFPGSVASEWQIASAADYNGDHNTDLLFRRDDGSLLMQTFVNNQLQSETSIGQMGSEWQVLGSSDFNGDTRDDILWQRNDGTLLIFDMNGPQITAAPIIGQIGLEWQLQGTGDYNGDGTGDMFWRAGDGRLLMFEINNNQVQKATVFGQMGNEWQVAGSGDFNGDHKTDILWQRNDGALLIFDMNGAQIQSMVNAGQIGPEWDLEGTADYNNDGTADLLWQRTDGALLLVEMANNQVQQQTIFGQVGTEWHLL